MRRAFATPRIALDATILSIKIGMIPVKTGSADICPITIRTTISASGVGSTFSSGSVKSQLRQSFLNVGS
jgi:hypothetical protein